LRGKSSGVYLYKPKIDIMKLTEIDRKEYCEYLMYLVDNSLSRDLSRIMWGKKGLKEVTARQYEWDLNPDSQYYMKYKLFIKSKELFFKDGNITTLHDRWQRFVFTFDNLMTLTDSELYTIGEDFD